MTTGMLAAWSMLVAVILAYGFRALKRPFALLAPPLLVAVGFSALAIASYLSEPYWALHLFLKPQDYARYLLLTALAMGLFVAAFELGRGLGYGSARPRAEIPRELLSAWTILLMGMGMAAQAYFIVLSGGFVAFYSAPHGSGAAWESTSAYIYNLPILLFPAIYLVFADRVLRGGWHGPVVLAALGVLALVAFQTVAFGNRGDTIRLMLITATLLLAFKERSLASLFVSGLVLAAGITAVSLFPYLRSALHLDAEHTASEALGALFETHSQVSGNTLFVGAAFIAVIDARDTFNHGLSWIYFFVNFVPRFLWADKPYGLGLNWWTLMDQHTEWEVAMGSAAGGVADAFFQFGWFSPLVWLVAGFAGGRIWARLEARRDIVSGGYLVGFLVGLTYAVLQDFPQGARFWVYFSVPIWALDVLSRLLYAGAAGQESAGASLRQGSAWPAREASVPATLATPALAAAGWPRRFAGPERVSWLKDG